MRYISFALTTDQVRRRKKTVTRRLGWAQLKPGTLLQPAVQCQGLKKGEKIEKLHGPIRVLTVRREPLNLMNNETGYGLREATLEGFPHLTGKQFIAMFCEHNGCEPQTLITRIEFEYVDKLEAK